MPRQFKIAVKEVLHFLNEAFEKFDELSDSSCQTFPNFLEETYNIKITNDSPISWYDEHLIFSNKSQYNWFLLQWK